MADRHITYKLKPFLQGGKIADAVDVEVDVTGFDGTGNLDSNDTDLQQVANALNDLRVGSGAMTMASLGGIILDVPSRIPLDTDISGTRTMHYRVYNYDRITSLSLFIDRGGLFSVVPVTHPTSNGEQTTTLTFPSINTSSKTTIVCYLVVNNDTVAGSYQIQAENIPGTDISIDRTSLSTVQGDDAQDMANELERLYGIVRSIQEDRSQEQRPLNTFENSVTITSTNLGDFINRNSLYVRSTNARVDFVLPAETTIVGQYPAIFELSHFGGTQRFDSGFSPTNTVVIRRPVDYNSNDPSTFLRRTSETGANLQFAELHRGDTAIITKEDADSPWVVIESSTDPRTSILPNGVFQLNSRGVTFPTNANGDHFIGGLSLYTPTQGDAFVVIGSGITEESTFGRSINTGDVIVSKVDSPSLLLDENNDDWLIIRDAGGGELTLREIRFLSTVGESDTFTDTRLETRSDVNSVRVFLSPFILDHAPFINPSTDPNNPQSGETGEYIGGDELDGADYDFQASASDIGDFDGVASATIANSAHVYIDIDGGFDIQENINDVFLVHIDRDGVEIARHNLNTEFRPITLTGSSDTYYVLDDVGATDNFSSINFHQGQTLNVVIRTTNRTFDLGESFNVIPSIKDASIPITKLDLNTQALIGADHSLSDSQESKLSGLETTGTATTWTSGDLYVKVNDHASGDLSNYVNVGQQNGIIPNYESTRHVTFLVPKFVTVTGLQKVENTATKLSVTSIGTILNRQAFTAELPAISGNNSPLDNVWQVDGTASNLVLSGAVDSFKIGVNNLGQDVLDRLNHDVTPPTLPDNIQRLSDDMTVGTRTESGWRNLPSPIRADLTRQYALLWDENRRNSTGNYFDDITGIDILGFQANNVFYYADPNDPLNLDFPGAGSYILDDNVRVRNTTGNTPITPDYNKLIAFDYALDFPLQTNSNFDMLRIGPSGTTALLGIAHDEGLYLNIGRGDGGTHSRTYTQDLQVDGNQWHTEVDVSTMGEAEIIIPNSLTGSLTINISVRLDDDGNDEGTHVETITITNVGSDQSFGNRTFNFTGFPDVTTTITYDHDNNDLSVTRRVLFLRPTHSFTNAALTYIVGANYEVTESWTTSTTYARHPVNAGNSHDDFGLFDPTRWNTEHVHERNRVLVEMVKWIDTDTSSDPEMAVRMVVDGETEGSSSNGYKIRLHRPKSDFTFNDISIGNTDSAVSHIQVYDYEEAFPPTEAELLTLYNAANRWLGAFTDRTDITDRFIINADLELGQGENIVLRSSDGSRWSITVDDDGDLETTKIV